MAVLALSVATPHAIDWLFASQEIICLVLNHLRLAYINTYLIVGALFVSVSQKSDFSCRGDDGLYFDAEFIRRPLLLFEVQGVEPLLVIKRLLVW